MSSANLPVPLGGPNLAATPVSSLLVEIGGRAVRGELRRLQGVRVRFALTLANETPLYLLVSFRIRRLGGDRTIAPGELWIDPYSHADLRFALPPWVALMGGALVVRLLNARIQHELVAPLPGASWLFGAAAGAGAAAVAAFGMAYAQPRIGVFAVPPVGVADSAVRVPYRIGGIGSATYRFEDERGTALASGPVAARAGTLELHLPAATATRAYTVQLRVAGPLGVAESAQPLTALASALPRPLIESLALDDAHVADGGTIVARYRTSARSGELAVLDDAGTIWVRAPIARGGVTRLQLPALGRDARLRVRLDARSGTRHESETVGVRITAPVQTESAGRTAGGFAGAQASVADERAAPGGRVRAELVPGARDVRLTLQTADGKTLATASAPPGATQAWIDVPRGAHGTLVLVVSYAVGAGEESVVRRITVSP